MEPKNVSNKEKEQKKVLRSFSLYCLGIFLAWSGYGAVFNLQSSINVEGGLGVTTLTISYAISIIICLFIPLMVRKYGAKVWLVIGDMAMVPFCLANLYPTYYTFLPTAIIMSITESVIWPSMAILNVFFASRYSAVTTRGLEFYTLYFSGYFFLVFQGAHVFGNMLSYMILYGFDQIPIPEYSQNCTVTNATKALRNETICIDEELHTCGANDCQDSTEISENINRYKPVNRVSFYVFIGVMFVFEISAVLIHAFCVPNDKKYQEKVKRNELNKIDMDRDETAATNELLDGSCNGDHVDFKDSKKDTDVSFAVLAKALLKQCMNLKQILLIPITIYGGLTMAFAAMELTRAYAACSLGVQWVGIYVAIYALFNAILSWVTGKYGRKLGRIAMFTIVLILDFGTYVYCLLWSPGPNIMLAVLVPFVTIGFSDGILQTLVNVTHIDYFVNNQDVAINIWNILYITGLGLGSGLSVTICVSTRIYFHMCLLVVGFTGLVVAEIIHKKEISRQKASSDNTSSDTVF